MRRIRRTLNMSVAALVRGLRRPGEWVQHWTKNDPNEIAVQLAEGNPYQRSAAKATRQFVFRKVNGRWSIQGPNPWTSRFPPVIHSEMAHPAPADQG
jgi:hypothetical protein